MQKQDNVTTLPGVLSTLAAGFDLTAKHLWLLILPILLDIFLWLGPRLSFQDLLLDLLAILPQEAGMAELSAPIAEIAPQTNLFTVLSVQLIGVPAVMGGLTTEETPIAVTVQQIPDWLTWFGLFCLFMVVGLLLTAVYFTLIAYVIKKQDTSNDEDQNIGSWGQRIGSNWLRLIGLAVVFLVNVFILYIPLLIIGSLLFLLIPGLGTFVAMTGPFLALWIAIFMCYAPFGVVLRQRPLLKSIIESFHIVRTYFLPTMLLLMTIFLLGTLLDWLLVLVENGTWFTAVNILAHAFVSTAMVAAMFIFYRDRYDALFSDMYEK